MIEAYNNLIKSIEHIKVLNELFYDENNLKHSKNTLDFEIYKENLNALINTFNKIDTFEQLYNQKDRQMILADAIEYIFLGRGFYSIGTRRGDNKSKQNFIKGILHFVNLLMTFESMTVEVKLRNRYLKLLAAKIPEIKNEDLFKELENHNKPIGLSDDPTEYKSLSKYFDKLLPKTAGGLWHELLVYVFILRNNYGYILPLLLHQKIYSLDDHLVPPDFLIIAFDKRMYGIEVGVKKEIQSGSFSLKTAIPTATIDTINSRISDRCPICKKWIGICPFIIKNYSDTNFEINKIEVKCMDSCNVYSKNEIAKGCCKYSKYSRKVAPTLDYTKHKYADGKHYHYKCVLDNLKNNKSNSVIENKDNTAVKTHYPHYTGLEELKYATI